MNVGIIIGRIGDVDGVALETEKWIHVLKRMGHDVFLLSGRFKEDVVAPERQTLLRLPPSASMYNTQSYKTGVGSCGTERR